MKVKSRNQTGIPIVTVGVDLSKDTFHVVALDGNGKKILREKFNQADFKV